MIEAQQLRKEFQGKIAVKDISFAVSKGEIFGLLGHNGAGKTTTIRMLTGQLRPSSGRSEIAGFESVHEQALIKPLIGVVAEVQNLYERMSAWENLILFAHLYGVTKTRVQETLALVQLQSRARDKVETFSNGMKQRLLIARALLHQPQVLFLDEPSRGLDPASAREVRETVKALASQGVTIFLTTHNMEEADDLCQRVAFIKGGELKALDTPQNLKIQHGKRTLVITLVNQQKVIAPLSNPQALQQVLLSLDGTEIQAIHSQEATLEEVFIQLAGRDGQL